MPPLGCPSGSPLGDHHTRSRSGAGVSVPRDPLPVRYVVLGGGRGESRQTHSSSAPVWPATVAVAGSAVSSASARDVASRTSTGFNSGHVISDLHLAGGVSDGWMQVQGWPNDRHADYGIYGRNLIASNFLRVSARARPFRV